MKKTAAKKKQPLSGEELEIFLLWLDGQMIVYESVKSESYIGRYRRSE